MGGVNFDKNYKTSVKFERHAPGDDYNLTFHFLKMDLYKKQTVVSNYSEDEILFQIEHSTHYKNQSLIKKP